MPQVTSSDMPCVRPGGSLRLCLIALVWASACGHEPEEPVRAVEGLLRPEVVAAGLASLEDHGDAQIVADWDLRDRDALDDWEIDPRISAVQGPSGVTLEVTEGAPNLRLRSKPPAGANAVLLRARVQPGKRVGSLASTVVAWSVDGNYRTRRRVLSPAQEFEDFVFVISNVPGWSEEPDTFAIVPLEIADDKDPRQAEIERVAFLRLPPAAMCGSSGYSRDAPLWPHDGVSRQALVGGVGFRWVASDIRLELGTQLDVGGLLPNSFGAPGTALRFEVALLNDGDRTVVLDEVLRRRSGDESAHFEEEIELDRWAGTTADLEFILTAPDGTEAAPAGIWLEPRLSRRSGPAPRYRRIVLVTVDTLRADYLSPYGRTDTDTPFFDELAGTGTLFEHCYATAGVTNPSHASILTSLHIPDHKVTGNSTALTPSAETLPEILGAHGYRTLGVVSVAHLRQDNSGLGQGFSYHSAPFSHPPRTAAETNEIVFDLLEEHGNEPLFLWVHYFDPHAPYEPKGEYDRMYYEGDPTDPSHPGLDESSLPDNWEDINYWSFLRGIRDPDFAPSQYRAQITYTDARLRELVDGIAAPGYEDSTLLVVTADHGESLGEHGLYCVHGGLFDPVSHVPLLVRGPGLPAGQRNDAIVSTVDIMPTILDLAGLPAAPRARGRSLKPLLHGDSNSQPAVFIFPPYVGGVRLGDFKYIKGRSAEWVFDLRSDPGELNDVSQSRTEVLEQARDLLESVHREGYADLTAPVSSEDPEMLEALRKLGYLDDD